MPLNDLFEETVVSKRIRGAMQVQPFPPQKALLRLRKLFFCQEWLMLWRQLSVRYFTS